MITVLSGGVGAARLLRALTLIHNPGDVTAVVNVGDDFVLHGLTICPDLDTITYTLAGLGNDELGWGLRSETWRVMDELAELGGAAWFRLGDRDLATHLYRSQRLREGATKSDVARELARHWGIEVHVLPVTDDDVATVFDTESGPMDFQEYFVRHGHDVTVRSIGFRGADEARPTNDVIHALDQAERIIIAPSNPLISIGPILKIPGVSEILRRRRNDVVAISPIINGHALKGPAGRLLGEMGHDVSCVGVARLYDGLIGTFVIDDLDAELAPTIRDTGVAVHVTTTVMAEPENAQRLARVVLS